MRYFISVCVVLTMISCDSPQQDLPSGSVGLSGSDNFPQRAITQEFKDYWYAGEAEISSYDLKQTRYGEERQGNAVLIFVTEPFDAQDQIKADQQKDSNRSVLKLNATRDFNTGIYPYKIMSSTFLPLDRDENAIKVATSIQEWCGHTYMQLNQRGNQYEGQLYSYFQSEGNREFTVSTAILENQIPSQLRLDPKLMPVGTIKIIPSTEYLRLSHEETKVHEASASLTEQEGLLTYQIEYDSGRKVTYRVEYDFPYRIMSWSEEFEDRGRKSTAIATLKKTLKTPYWNQNSEKYAVLRDSLGL